MSKEILRSTCMLDAPAAWAGSECHLDVAHFDESRVHQADAPDRARGVHRTRWSGSIATSSGVARATDGLDVRRSAARSGSRQWARRDREFARNRIEPLRAALERRHRGHQPFRIGMARRAEKDIDRRVLHDPARRTSQRRGRRTPRSRRDRARSASPPCRARRANRAEVRGSAPGSSRPAPSSARRRSAGAAGRRSRSRSSRAGACRLKGGADIRRRGARRRRCERGRAARSLAPARRSLRQSLMQAQAVRRSGRRSSSTGLSDDIGSWNTIAISRPRTARRSRSGARSKSCPA